MKQLWRLILRSKDNDFQLENYISFATHSAWACPRNIGRCFSVCEMNMWSIVCSYILDSRLTWFMNPVISNYNCLLIFAAFSSEGKFLSQLVSCLILDKAIQKWATNQPILSNAKITMATFHSIVPSFVEFALLIALLSFTVSKFKTSMRYLSLIKIFKKVVRIIFLVRILGCYIIHTGNIMTILAVFRWKNLTLWLYISSCRVCDVSLISSFIMFSLRKDAKGKVYLILARVCSSSSG